MATLTRQRMAHLHPTLAKWQLYEFDQREDALAVLDTSDRGNLATRLVHAIDEGLTRTGLLIRSRAFAASCRKRKSLCSRRRLRADCVYTLVPAFAGAIAPMIDILAMTQEAPRRHRAQSRR